MSSKSYCNHHTKKHGNWYIHPELFAQENLGTTQKIQAEKVWKI